ncbi:MAG: nucleotidyltransferase domain-containing protein [Erythrobacter sp.]|nr:nucleotidyltransferase domain-containing protein [Erythrobacter sp.]
MSSSAEREWQSEEWARALQRLGHSPLALLAMLHDQVGISPHAPVILSGSIASGLAGKDSDIDLYVFADRSSGASAMPFQRSIHDVDGTQVDVSAIGQDRIAQLVARVKEFADTGCTDSIIADSFSEDERHLLDAIRSGLPIQAEEEVRRLCAPLEGDVLARLKFIRALAAVKRGQVSAEALRKQGDWRTLLFVARDVLDASADMLLAAAGNTSPSTKWRVRNLERHYPHHESIVFPGIPQAPPAETYLELSSFPSRPSASTALKFAHAAIAWSRTVAVYTTCRLDNACERFRAVRAAHPEPGKRGFALDTFLGFAGGEFVMRRLEQDAAPWILSGEATSTICALDFGRHWHGDHDEAEAADPGAIEALVRFADDEGLLVPIDD